MIRFKAWLILSSGFWAEFWHLIIPLSLYLWLAIRLDGSLASWRAFRIVALVAMAFEVEEAIEKWAFGLRIDGSRLFGSLGASGNLSGAQQCRAEFYTPGYGWIPVNPADVRKAIRDENLSDGDPKLTVLKKLLFGFWEMNWIGFNAALDVSLRGSIGNPLPFLSYPTIETAHGRFDSLDTDRLSYNVTATHTEPY